MSVSPRGRADPSRSSVAPALYSSLPSPAQAAGQTLQTLPIDIALAIAARLDPRSLLALAQTCSVLRPIPDDPSVWSALFLTHLGVVARHTKPAATLSPATVAQPQIQVSPAGRRGRRRGDARAAISTKNSNNTDNTSGAGNCPPSIQPTREAFQSEVHAMCGSWRVSTGAVVRGVAVNLRSGCVLAVRAQGGTERTIAEVSPGCGDAAYVMTVEHAGEHPSNGHSTLHTSGDSAAQQHYFAPRHHPTPHRVELDFRLTPKSIPFAKMPWVLRVDGRGSHPEKIKNIAFPIDGLTLRLVHAVQLADDVDGACGGSRSNANYATDKSLRDVCIDILCNGAAVESNLAVRAAAVGCFAPFDVTIPASLLHAYSARVNTLTVRYVGRGGVFYWLKELRLVPTVLGLPPFDVDTDGATLPITAAPRAMRTNSRPRVYPASCKSASSPISGSPTSVAGFHA
jgi:hypothetical protein